MSRPRFLADQDINDHIVRGVLHQEPAIEFLHVRDFGMQESSDSEILAFADREQYLVVSHDVNTMSAAAMNRLAAGDSCAGLFIIRQRSLIARAIDDLVIIWAASELEEWQGQIVFLPWVARK